MDTAIKQQVVDDSEECFEVKLKVKDRKGQSHTLTLSLDQLRQYGINVYMGSFFGGCFDLTNEDSKNLVMYSTKKRGERITTKDQLEGAIENINEGLMDNFIKEDFGNNRRY